MAVRKGGVQTPKGFLFELSGGDIVLDFVNTVDLRPTPQPKELIPTYSEFLSWSRQSRVLTPRQELTLRKIGNAHPGAAEVIRKKAVQIRECLFQIFSHLADDRKIPSEVIQQWNRIVSDSLPRYEMIQTPEGLSWIPRFGPTDLDAPLWPVIQSAIQLLTGRNVTRIRKCDGENCNWVFLDMSKRGNRRWCDMTVCGNRAKARAFYARKKRKKI